MAGDTSKILATILLDILSAGNLLKNGATKTTTFCPKRGRNFRHERPKIPTRSRLQAIHRSLHGSASLAKPRTNRSRSSRLLRLSRKFGHLPHGTVDARGLSDLRELLGARSRGANVRGILETIRPRCRTSVLDKKFMKSQLETSIERLEMLLAQCRDVNTRLRVERAIIELKLAIVHMNESVAT